jgi:hypothetical protein
MGKHISARIIILPFHYFGKFGSACTMIVVPFLLPLSDRLLRRGKFHHFGFVANFTLGGYLRCVSSVPETSDMLQAVYRAVLLAFDC